MKQWLNGLNGFAVTTRCSGAVITEEATQAKGGDLSWQRKSQKWASGSRLATCTLSTSRAIFPEHAWREAANADAAEAADAADADKAFTPHRL
jgi:hypothetical protein